VSLLEGAGPTVAFSGVTVAFSGDFWRNNAVLPTTGRLNIM